MTHKIITIIITVICSIIAAAIVMILHELPKAIAYKCYTKNFYRKYNKIYSTFNDDNKIFKLYRYIDPVGVILSITCLASFSKQYPFVIKSKKASLIIGIIGYLSLGITFVASVIGYRILFDKGGYLLGDYYGTIAYIVIALQELIKYILLFSIMMFIANLFPLATFDLSLIIAAIAPIKYIKIRKFDLFYKLIFLILSLLEVFSTLGIYIANYFLLV